MPGEGLDGAVGDLGVPQGWRCVALVAQDYGLGPSGPLVPSEDGEENLLKRLRGSLERPHSYPLDPFYHTDLAWEAGSRLLWSQEAAGNVRLVGDGRWPRGEFRKAWGAGCGGWERLWEGSRSQEAGTYKKEVRLGLMLAEGPVMCQLRHR